MLVITYPNVPTGGSWSIDCIYPINTPIAYTRVIPALTALRLYTDSSGFTEILFVIYCIDERRTYSQIATIYLLSSS